MQSLFFFIVSLSILIVIHEFGHFWVARKCGVKVIRFSVGFGTPFLTWRDKLGTEFAIAPIPLGGYVKMLDEREGPVAPEEQHLSFNNKSLKARTAIVAAGPLANLLFAVAAYWLIFVSGIPGLRPITDQIEPSSVAESAGLVNGVEILSVDSLKTPTWQSVIKAMQPGLDKGDTIAIEAKVSGTIKQYLIPLPKLGIEKRHQVLDEIGISPLRPAIPPIIGEIIPSHAAEKAGLQPGDKLLWVDGHPLDNWAQWVKLIQASPNQALTITIERNEAHLELILTPDQNESGEGYIGAAVDTTQVVIPDYLNAELSYSPVEALFRAVEEVWNFSSLTLQSLGGMLTGAVSTDNIGGPISIAQMAGSSAEQGLQNFINFMAVISITLGILNLLPIPVLDGGHLLLFFIEWVKGEPLNEAAQMFGQKVGIVFLLTLMFFAFYNDLTRLFG